MDKCNPRWRNWGAGGVYKRSLNSIYESLENIMSFKIMVTLCVSFLYAILILQGFPVKYHLGFLSLIFISFILVRNLLYFLTGLFLLRPALNYFFSSIRFSVGGVDLGLGGAISLFLICGALLYALDLKFKDSRRLRLPIIWLYFMFCLVNCVVFFYSNDKSAAAKVLLGLFSIFSILILTGRAVDSKLTARSLIRAILFSAVIPIGWGFVDYHFFGGFKGRFAGTFGHPNILAFYLLIIIGCLIFQLDNDKRLVEISWKRGCILLILITALVLTQTRSGWAAFLLMTAIYISRFNKRLLLPSVILIIALAFMPFVQQKITNTFSLYGNEIYVNKDSSFGWRLEQWKPIFKSAMERPIYGYGIGSAFFLGKDSLGAHNDYLKYFAESGIIGLLVAYIPYLYLLMSSLKRLRKKEQDISETSDKLAAFIVCFIPVFLVMSISENLADYVVIHWYLWALVGIYFALTLSERQVLARAR